MEQKAHTTGCDSMSKIQICPSPNGHEMKHMVQDLIYQQKDALMELKNTAGPMDMTPMFYELQNRIMELERRVNDEHRDWN